MSINKLLGAAAVYGLTACGAVDVKTEPPDPKCTKGYAFGKALEFGQKAAIPGYECTALEAEGIEGVRDYVANSSGQVFEIGEFLCWRAYGVGILDKNRLQAEIAASDICPEIRARAAENSTPDPGFSGEITIWNDDEKTYQFPGITILEASCDNPNVKIEILERPARVLDEESINGKRKFEAKTLATPTNLIRINTSGNDYIPETKVKIVALDSTGKRINFEIDFDKHSVYQAQ